MWYAVETAFVNGKQFKSIPLFEPDADEASGRVLPGTCMAGHNEEPHNTCQKFLKGLMEIHTDWFQTKEQAMDFINGGITYVIHYRAVYKKSIKSTIRTFLNWEAVPAQGEFLPYRGVYKDHPEGEVVKPYMEKRMEKEVAKKEPEKCEPASGIIAFDINEIINWANCDYKDQIVRTHHIKEDTWDNAFRQVYALRHSSKYDSALGRRYDFVDKDLEKDYVAWKEKNEGINMFYGDSVVD